MMEIVYGPVILNCAVQSLAFGLMVALLVPAVGSRFVTRNHRMGPSRRLGLGLMAAGLFGLAHLTVVCSADGFPPRILQSTGVALLTIAGIGALLWNARGDQAIARA